MTDEQAKAIKDLTHTVITRVRQARRFDPTGDVESIIAAALATRERAVLDDVLVYANMRGMLADQAKHVEHLAGNIVKEAREDGARAELFGLEQWARQQQAEAGR
jgi:hypothetical protein